jgi:hypothetical protein
MGIHTAERTFLKILLDNDRYFNIGPVASPLGAACFFEHYKGQRKSPRSSISLKVCPRPSDVRRIGTQPSPAAQMSTLSTSATSTLSRESHHICYIIL